MRCGRQYERNKFNGIARTILPQQVAPVFAYRVLSDTELSRGLFAAQGLQHASEDILLARCEEQSLNCRYLALFDGLGSFRRRDAS